MKRAWVALALLIAAAGGAAAQGDAPGRQKARACAVCHGALGVSQAPDAPHLAGQPASYLARQLRAYRSGERRHELMNIIAKSLSDTDIEDLSQWYASIAVSAAPPK